MSQIGPETPGNLTQIKGVAVDSNSGSKSAATLRIVLATDQPQLTNALKVDGSAVTQPVSGTVTANAGSGTFAVSGTFWQATQPVSAAALPLPSGASTEATLSTLNGKVTAVNTGAVVLAAGSAVIGHVILDSGTTAVTQATAANLKAQIATTTTATKAAVTFQASATNTASGTTTGSTIDLTTALGCTVCAVVTNGATGPTLACRFRVQVSNDNSNFTDFSSETTATGNSVVTQCQPVVLPMDILYARSVFDSNTSQSVTVIAYGHKTSSLASA